MSKQISGNRILLPTIEACKKTGFSSAYIQRLLRDERLEGVKIGAVWLVYEDSLEAFFSQPRKRGPKGPRKKSEEGRLDSPSNTKRIERVVTTSRTESNGTSQRTQRSPAP